MIWSCKHAYFSLTKTDDGEVDKFLSVWTLKTEWMSGCQELREGRMGNDADGDETLGGGMMRILELMVIVVQPCEHIKHYWNIL